MNIRILHALPFVIFAALFAVCRTPLRAEKGTRDKNDAETERLWAKYPDADIGCEEVQPGVYKFTLKEGTKIGSIGFGNGGPSLNMEPPYRGKKIIFQGSMSCFVGVIADGDPKPRTINVASLTYDPAKSENSPLASLGVIPLNDAGIVKSDVAKSGWINWVSWATFTDGGRSRTVKLTDITFWVNRGGENWLSFKAGKAYEVDGGGHLGAVLPVEVSLNRQGVNSQVTIRLDGKHLFYPLIKDSTHLELLSASQGPEAGEQTAAESRAATQPAGANSTGSLVIRKALYGDLPDGAAVDVTDKIRSMVKNDALSVIASNVNFGGPADRSENLTITRAELHWPPAPDADVTEMAKALQKGDTLLMGTTLGALTVHYKYDHGEALFTKSAADGSLKIPPPMMLRVEYSINGVDMSKAVEMDNTLKINDKSALSGTGSPNTASSGRSTTAEPPADLITASQLKLSISSVVSGSRFQAYVGGGANISPPEPIRLPFGSSGGMPAISISGGSAFLAGEVHANDENTKLVKILCVVENPTKKLEHFKIGDISARTDRGGISDFIAVGYADSICAIAQGDRQKVGEIVVKMEPLAKVTLSYVFLLPTSEAHQGELLLRNSAPVLFKVKL